MTKKKIKKTSNLLESMLVHKTTFNCLGLTDRLVQTLKKQQYAFPTPIQEKAIPLLIERNDLLGIAPVSYTHLTLPTRLMV